MLTAPRALVLFAGVVAFVACAADSETAVQFIDLRAEDVAATRAVVRFDTSVPTTCEIEYGLAADALTERAEDPSMVGEELSIEHEVPVEDLEPATTYYFRARATDAAGETWFSEVQRFETLEAEQVEGVNIAVDAQVVDHSSAFGDSAQWAPDNAIDGQMSTEWATMGDGDGSFLVLDLGSVRAIDTFGFRSREMPDGTSIATSVQLVVEDDAGETVLGPFDTPDPAVRYTFALDGAQMQRVRVEVVTSSGGNVGAREIELYAAE